MALRPTAQQLHDAILANSPELVAEHLEAGADPDKSPRLTLLRTDEQDSDDDGPQSNVESNTWVLGDPDGSTSLSPLHMAVIGCYQSKRDPSCDYGSHCIARNAFGILTALIEAGANVAARSRNLLLCNMPEYNWMSAPHKCTPCELAAFLKQHLDNSWKSEQTICLDMVITSLQKAARSAGHLQPKTVPVPQSAFRTWSSLVFSERFSDVRFMCEADDAEIPAHRCVLATASRYFAALFEGPWQENVEGGRLQTSNSAYIMRAVVRFIYTGDIKPEMLDEQATELMGVAAEYELQDLRTLCEKRCLATLSLDNVKERMQLAHLHECKELKRGCFKFVQRNAATLLTSSSMLSLMSEDPALWADMTKAISNNPDPGPVTKKPKTGIHPGIAA